MGALDNTRRINQAIIFLPTNEERQISNLRGRNQMLEERLAKIENFILRKDLDNPIESSGTGPAWPRPRPHRRTAGSSARGWSSSASGRPQPVSRWPRPGRSPECAPPRVRLAGWPGRWQA